jgi:hypothetical protein
MVDSELLNYSSGHGLDTSTFHSADVVPQNHSSNSVRRCVRDGNYSDLQARSQCFLATTTQHSFLTPNPSTLWKSLVFSESGASWGYLVQRCRPFSMFHPSSATDVSQLYRCLHSHILWSKLEFLVLATWQPSKRTGLPALKDASIENQISVLLAVGGIPSLASERMWLKMNEFIENKSLRLSPLFKACVPLSYSIYLKHSMGTEQMILTLRKGITPEVFVTPLCCAIIFERYQISQLH